MAAIRWMMETKGIPAGQRKGSDGVKSQIYQGAVTKAALTTETKHRKKNPKQTQNKTNFFVLGLFQCFVHVKQNAETKQK